MKPMTWCGDRRIGHDKCRDQESGHHRLGNERLGYGDARIHHFGRALMRDSAHLRQGYSGQAAAVGG